MIEPAWRDRIDVEFAGAAAGIEPLTWGQKAIWQDMQDSGNQFNMQGFIDLPEGSSVEDATARVSALLARHACLRVRLRADESGHPCQEVAASGQLGVELLTFPDDADPAQVQRYRDHLFDTWYLERFDFHRDWPLRVAVLRHRGACLYMVWVLSHLAADGGGHVLLLDDLLAGDTAAADTDPRHPDVLDIAQAEQTSQYRQLSSRAMRYWESQLRHIPVQTFGAPSPRHDQREPRYWQARFSSPAAHLAMLAISMRTGTDLSRVTLAVIATAIGRTTGVSPLVVKVMVNNRFRPGLAHVIAPVAQNSVVTIDVADASIDEVVARARSASTTAGMRAYYDPDELREVMASLDAARGYPATITCRINDQRAMVRRDDEQADPDAVTQGQVAQKLKETSLTWLGRRDNMHEQANVLIENRPGVLSLHIMWDRWSLADAQVEALLRAVEAIAVEAAFDPAAPTGVSSHPAAASKPARHT
jgi:hypothetical protein